MNAAPKAVAILVLVLTRGAFAASGAPLSDGDQLFLTKVKPLLESRCQGCHGPEKRKANLRLDSREAALKGGDSGPSVVPGKPQDSLLLTSVMHSKDDLKMPPKEKLTAQDIAVLDQWIAAGAPWPDQKAAEAVAPQLAPGERIGDAWSDPRNPVVRAFGGQRLDLWSLKPVRRLEPPQVAHSEWAKNDLDRFVLARLAEENTPPPAMADARTLVRRLYFDLHGLPPTPEQAAKYESGAQGDADKATAALVADLLASPRFGEHFARLWLDVVRYSDSNGFDWDELRPEAWRFRDYVIRAFNADKPFDQFIREQLAGDELVAGAPRNAAEQDALIATGYLRLGPWDNSAQAFMEEERARTEMLADLTETTGGAFLGLTMSCCRCHDHKYDPLTQADHYRLRAFFAPVRFGDDVPLDLAPEQERIGVHNAKLDERIDQTKQQIAAILAPARQRLTAKDPAKKEITDDEAVKLLAPKEKADYEALAKVAESLTQQRLDFTHGLIMADNPQDVPVVQILFQGNYKEKRAPVVPGFLSALDPNPAAISTPPNAQSTGRRLALANWIASPANPLTARVFVNRIWQSLMGRALVATPNDFGLAGARPEDAALLDWLASEFVRQGWSVKQLVTVIVSSATYRQAATPAGGSFTTRQPRRLTAEELRDSLLVVSGLLNDKSGGKPVWPNIPEEVLNANPALLDDNKEKTKGWYPSPKSDQYARSIFLVQKRNTRVPLLETFDLPENSTSCARRNVSTVAPQALTLLNGSLAIEAARAFAARLERECGGQDDQALIRAFELAFQRAPVERELAATRKLLEQRSLAEVCRALLNVNEFVYVD